MLSWSSRLASADVFAEFGAGNIVVLGKRDVTPVLDIARIARHFDIEGLDDPDEHLADMIRDAAREREIVCEHTEPMTVRPGEALHFFADSGRRVRICPPQPEPESDESESPAPRM